MTAFQQATFSVKTGERSAATCSHGWTRAGRRGFLECVLCGERSLLFGMPIRVDPAMAPGKWALEA